MILNVDESTLRFTAEISRKFEFVTAYLFATDFLLSRILFLAEFADLEQRHPIVVAGCFFVCTHSSYKACHDRPPAHRCHEPERNSCDEGSSFTSAATAVYLARRNARTWIWTFDASFLSREHVKRLVRLQKKAR
jgi:hypothetical protein